MNTPYKFVPNVGGIQETTQTIVVSESQATLEQIPDTYRKVQIQGLGEYPQGAIPQTNGFVVNYSNGVILFSPDIAEGTRLSAHYYGIGVLQISADRVILPESEEQLNQFMDRVKQTASSLDDIQCQIWMEV